MAFSIKHAKVSAIADGADTSLVLPSDWNAALVVAGADVGGIPYCPTAATIATAAGLKWNPTAAAGEGLILAAGTATTAVSALSQTQTWNNAAVAFNALDFTVTDTASAAGSNALRIRGGAAGTTNLLSVNKSGQVVCGPTSVGSTALPSLCFPSDLNTGFYLGTGNQMIFTVANADRMNFSDGLKLHASSYIGFSNTAYSVYGTAMDIAISRVSAGVLGVGNGTAADFSGRPKLTSTIHAGVAIASLNASPTTGEIQSVTDSLVPVIGSTVVAGGAAKALVWWNGANWTVIGK